MWKDTIYKCLISKKRGEQKKTNNKKPLHCNMCIEYCMWGEEYISSWCINGILSCEIELPLHLLAEVNFTKENTKNWKFRTSSLKWTTWWEHNLKKKKKKKKRDNWRQQDAFPSSLALVNQCQNCPGGGIQIYWIHMREQEKCVEWVF